MRRRSGGRLRSFTGAAQPCCSGCTRSTAAMLWVSLTPFEPRTALRLLRLTARAEADSKFNAATHSLQLCWRVTSILSHILDRQSPGGQPLDNELDLTGCCCTSPSRPTTSTRTQLTTMEAYELPAPVNGCAQGRQHITQFPRITLPIFYSVAQHGTAARQQNDSPT
jgi:hypothetical protein